MEYVLSSEGYLDARIVALLAGAAALLSWWYWAHANSYRASSAL